MRTLGLVCCGVLLLAVANALAAAPEGVPPKPAAGSITATSAVVPTPEMWFYEQYQQQYSDPKVSVRKKAEFRSAEREKRLASMRWFGLSNSRPRAATDPFNADYSPGWTSNNLWDPYRWSAAGPTVVVQPTNK